MSAFANKEAWPPWLVHAAKDVGVRELPGIHVHPRIAKYYKHTQLGGEPNDDEVAWCSAAMCAWFEEVGIASTKSAKARSWLGWGQKLDKPKLGCVAVFSRGDPAGQQGHVGLYMEDAPNGHVWLLGGNQGNSVRFSCTYELARVLGWRWPANLDK